MQLDDLDFADDLALLSQTQQQMQKKTTSVVAAVGLNIDKGKSRILRYNTECINPITIDGEDLEDVKIFTYLGSIIGEYSGSDADVEARIVNRSRSNMLKSHLSKFDRQVSISGLFCKVDSVVVTFSDPEKENQKHIKLFELTMRISTN
ncbi:unnamed protein product [Schistosoma curassoni]|uniref:Reverse transcriptase domain-containing protein n=1 Tax=Schistosoma curassoni TaxID=6186 RepID=A0A183K3V7_9TREM|nr:unnamed protein product [Schistosoma curassoni]